MLSPFSLSQSLESGHIETLPGAAAGIIRFKMGNYRKENIKKRICGSKLQHLTEALEKIVWYKKWIIFVWQILNNNIEFSDSIKISTQKQKLQKN